MTADSFAGSSWIQGAKYDSETQRMQIYLGGSEVYECEGVDSDTWSQFKMAKSKGAYFNKYIRGQFNSSSI
jgi:hypothetical protein